MVYGLLYMIFQMAGAFLAAASAHWLLILDDGTILVMGSPKIPQGNTEFPQGLLRAMYMEAVLSFAFTLVVLNVSQTHANGVCDPFNYWSHVCVCVYV